MNKNSYDINRAMGWCAFRSRAQLDFMLICQNVGLMLTRLLHVAINVTFHTNKNNKNNKIANSFINTQIVRLAVVISGNTW